MLPPGFTSALVSVNALAARGASANRVSTARHDAMRCMRFIEDLLRMDARAALRRSAGTLVIVRPRRRNAQRPHTTAMSLPIDAELDTFNARVGAAVPRSADASAIARRARSEAIARHFPFPADGVARDDHWIAGAGHEVPLRLYRPRQGTLPALVYLHGGGWVSGSSGTHDGFCGALARDAGILVASVHCRRAPENPWPAPNDDAYAALAWLAGNAGLLDIDAKRIGVGGDSAGGHLAIGAALEARDRGTPAVAWQLLIYPVVEPDFDTPSYIR